MSYRVTLVCDVRSERCHGQFAFDMPSKETVDNRAIRAGWTFRHQGKRKFAACPGCPL